MKNNIIDALGMEQNDHLEMNNNAGIEVKAIN